MKALAMLAGFAALTMSGCHEYTEGGGGVSDGQSVYVSTAELPWTITVEDWRDGTVLWTYELPVGRKLVIKFEMNRYENNPNRPDVMRWEEMAATTNYGGLNSEMAVPRTARVVSKLREPGESAPGAKVKNPGASASAGAARANLD